MFGEEIRFEVSRSISTITLNRPRSLNALAGSMREDLLSAIQEAPKCSRVLVLRGAGKAFCAGGDVHFMAAASTSELAALIQAGRRVVSELRGLSIPTLASLSGVAAGAGLGLALACDLRIASTSALLGATFVRLGLHPDWGTSYLLTRLAGTAAARDLIFTGRMVPASEARDLGLVNWVVEAAELEESTMRKAEELRAAAPVAIQWAKRTLDRCELASLEQVLRLEEEAQLACFSTEDAQEGIAAFREKRQPDFRGR